MEFQIATGNPDLDRQQLAQVEQQYAAAGYSVQATPLPTGGFHVRLIQGGAPAGPPPGGAPGYGAPDGSQGFGAPGGPPQGGGPGFGQPGGPPPGGAPGYGQPGGPPPGGAPGYGQPGGPPPGGGPGFGQPGGPPPGGAPGYGQLGGPPPGGAPGFGAPDGAQGFGAPGGPPAGGAPGFGGPGGPPPGGAPGFGAPGGTPGFGQPGGAPGFGGPGGPPQGAPQGGGAPAAGAFGQAAGSVLGGVASGMLGGALGGAVGGLLGGKSSGGSAASSEGGFLKDWRVLHGAAVVIAAIAGAIMFVMPDMAVGVIAGIAAGIALVLSVVLLLIARPKILYAIGAVGLSVILGGVAGGAMWFFTHPSIQVDNPSKEAIRIYVDGKAVLSVNPDSHGSVNVHKGKHSFGWSAKADAKPTATVDAEVKFLKAHLYNPNKTGCYWLVVDTYGNVSDGGRANGPQSIQEFYVFDTVDTWWGDNPDFVTVKKKEQGKVKTALQRAKMCMEFRDCGLPVREKLIECQKAAINKDDEAAFQACGDEAARTCVKAPAAPPAGSAAPKASAKGTSKAPAPKTR